MLLYFLLLPFRDFLLYRLRGKDLGISDTFNRAVFWGIPNSIDICAFCSYFSTSNEGRVALIVAALTMGYLSACVEHSDWQSPSARNYEIMGLITTGMLTMMLLPLFFVHGALHLAVFLPLGFMGAVASWLGYSSLVANRELTLFGTQLCRPVAIGGSEWEEAFIGFFAFGIPKMVIGLTLYWGAL